MKYIASFSANNGTTVAGGMEYTNISKAVSGIRTMAEGNRYAGNDCKWEVRVDDMVVAAGGVGRDGKRYRVKDGLHKVDNNNHGGLRPGVGRKLTSDLSVPIAVRVSQEAADILSLQSNKSEFIDRLIKSCIDEEV